MNTRIKLDNMFHSNEWYTPPDILAALGEEYDLDPCSPGQDHWVKAKNIYTREDNGLSQKWEGFVFMNPPFGGRNGVVPWLVKFLDHANGIAIVSGLTSSGWFHDYAIKSDAILFPKGKTKFISPNKGIGTSPGTGVAILATGERGFNALKQSGLGWFIDNKTN